MKKYRIIATLSEIDLQNLMRLNVKGVDIFEIRLDLLSKEFLKNKLKLHLQRLHKPLLFTYRLPEDSSLNIHYSLNVEDIKKILNDFNDSGNYVDVDFKQKDSLLNLFKELKYKKIYSLHNFSGTYSYSEMLYYIKNANDQKGIYKFAVLPKTFTEGMEFLFSIKKLSRTHKMIGVWMGEMGSFSRIYGDKFGSSFTYATLSEPKAPGQVSVNLIIRSRKLVF